MGLRSGATLLRFDHRASQLDRIPVERRAIQFFFPACDHEGGDAVANLVDERAAATHEPQTTRDHLPYTSNVNVSGIIAGRGRGCSGVAAGVSPNSAVTV